MLFLSAGNTDKLVIPDLRGREPWQRAARVKDQSSATVTTLDLLAEYYQINPSLVKIDCEGYEPFILKGGRRLLEVQRPAFMVECNDYSLLAANTSRAELFGMFRQYDYAVFHMASFGSSHPFGV